MGLIEDIDAMEGLSDEQKSKLKAAHLSDVEPLRAERERLARESRKDKVEEEVKNLGALFADDEGKMSPQAIPLMKYTRRLLLSDTDADPATEPEAILMADHELGLSGDQATGAHTQEGITAAGAVRKFIELLPTAEKDGKVRLLLSDVAIMSDDHGREPGSGAVETDDEHTQRAEHLSATTGLERPKRTRRRYMGGRPMAPAGGES